jgi:predicted deacetylase
VRGRRLTISLLYILILLLGSLPFAGATEPDNDYPSIHSHYALIRLEDVGPGGPYQSKEQLGQLRAVIDYLANENVPFHVSVIPRDRRLQGDHHWVDISIEHPDEKSQPFIQLMRYAEQRGGILGMHGYTHQYGNQKRPDGYENTSIGREFDVPDAPETKTTAYAAERIERSLQAFQRAGLHPLYWESPHYADTWGQRRVFSSYMGILYEPNYQDIRSFKDIVYQEEVNRFGNPSLGAVYVPAPLRYVQDGNSVTRILQEAGKGNLLASLYFHPYLEFPFLEPVLDANGKPVIRDGLPEFRYKPGSVSYLHRLVSGLRKEGYRFGTLFDVVPFAPAHRIPLPQGASFVGAADLQGKGWADRIAMDARRGKVYVQAKSLDWPRNQDTGAWELWLDGNRPLTGTPLFADWNGDGRPGLLLVQTNGICQLYRNTGRQFVFGQEFRLPSDGEKPLNGVAVEEGRPGLLLWNRQTGQARLYRFQGEREEVDRLQIPPLPVGPRNEGDGECLLADVNGDGRTDLVFWSRREHVAYVSFAEENESFLPWRVVYRAVAYAVAVTGDVNGDGKADLLLFYPKEGILEVARSTGTGFVREGGRFGPWARGENRVVSTADLDGNKKEDILSYSPADGVVDVALSYQGIR